MPLKTIRIGLLLSLSLSPHLAVAAAGTEPSLLFYLSG